MPIQQRFSWAAMLVAMGSLLGCDGEPHKDLEAAVQEIKTALAARTPPAAAEPGAPQQEFHRQELNAFRAGWCQSSGNASLKLLLSAIGPKPLLEHLESFKTQALTRQETASAEALIALIHQAYGATHVVNTEPFFNALQHVAPFDERNIVGDFRYKVENDVYRSVPAAEQIPGAVFRTVPARHPSRMVFRYR